MRVPPPVLVCVFLQVIQLRSCVPGGWSWGRSTPSQEFTIPKVLLPRYFPLFCSHSLHAHPNYTIPLQQELYRWPSVAAIARKMYGLRYRLLPFYYTLFYNAHRPVSSLTRPASTVVRPMFFEFPSDPATYGMDQQFMVGSAILVCPVLEEG